MEKERDLKLKQAMAEIKAILKNHDVAGIVYLASQTHCEYMTFFNQSWSIIEPMGSNQVKIKLNDDDYKNYQDYRSRVDANINAFLAFNFFSISSHEYSVQLIEAMNSRIEHKQAVNVKVVSEALH